MTGAGRIATSLLAGLALAVAAFAQGGGSDASTADRFRIGQEVLAAGRFADAEAEYRAVLEADPGLTEARANLGLVLFLQGEYAAAASEFERASAENPDLPAARLFLGLSHLRLGAPGEAIPLLERSIKDSPGNLEARRALAACYVAEGDYAGAVREFQAAHALGKDRTEAWHALGRNYMNLMSELAGRLVSRQPDSVWAARLGADMLGLSRAWEAAAQYYETALEKRPDAPGLRAGLGAARLRLGDADAAAREFQAELRADPHSEQARLGLAEVSLLRGDAAGAMEQVAAVWRSFPEWLAGRPAFPVGEVAPAAAAELLASVPAVDSGPARFLQAALLDAAGDPDAADRQWALLESAVPRETPAQEPQLSPADLCRRHRYGACAARLESEPSLTRADLLLLGRAYFALRRYDRAAVAFTHAMRGAEDAVPEGAYWTVRTLQLLADQCFRQVEELEPGSWRVHQMRAEAHRQRQADDAAIAEYRRAIELKPDEAELHRDLGLLHLLNNAYPEAQQALDRALELDASNPRSLYLVGRLRIARQEHAESIPYLEAALRLDPNLIEARPSLGRAYLRVGRVAEAAAELERGLPLDYYGDIHYSLFQAHRRLGNADAAKQALDRSVAMRKRSFVRDRAKLDRWIKGE